MTEFEQHFSHYCLMRCNAYSAIEISSSGSAQRRINESFLNQTCPTRAVFHSAPRADRQLAGWAAKAARASDQERCQAVPAATAPVARV
jgi:hypothetical protein